MTGRRRIGTVFGRTAYRLYYRPKAFVRGVCKRGAWESLVDERERRRMVRAAAELKSVAYDDARSALDVHFMSGDRYHYQTVFCAWSLAAHSEVPIRPVVYDDGTLTSAHTAGLRRVLPNAAFVTPDEIESRLDRHLPRSRFPRLRGHREVKPHLKKLIDFHAGLTGWKLFLDSDMLFFRRPGFLIDWLANPSRPLYMVDVHNAYGYSPGLMTELAGAPIPDLVNIGIMGLNCDALDWDRIEGWIGSLLDREGPHYNITQALCAMLMAQGECAVAPAEEYVVLPTEAEAVRPAAVLHHYVAESKSLYYRYGWRECLAR